MKKLYSFLFIITFFQSFISFGQAADSVKTPQFKAHEIKKHSAKIYYNIPQADYVMVFYRVLGETDWQASKLKSLQDEEALNYIKLTNLLPALEYEYTAMVLESTSSNSADLTISYKTTGTFTTTADYAIPLPGYGAADPNTNSRNIAYSPNK